MPRPPASPPAPASPSASSGAHAARHASRDKYICRGLRIVHEDDDVIVIEKPAGMLSAIVPGDHGDNVFGKVKEHVKDAAKRRGSRAWIIHRLDREASGLLVFAKSDRAYELLKEELSARRMHRVYAAIVEREFAPGESQGTVRSYLYEDTRGMIHSVESPGEVPLHLRRDTDHEEHATAKPAVTHYRVLTQARNRSLLHVRLETGRKHQIRVHLNQIGHSIIGDRRYGSDSGTETRLCLHAMTLAFIHPATGAEVRFESPIPPAMLKLVGIKGEDQVDFGDDVPIAAAPKAPPKLHDSKKPAPATDKGWEHVATWYDSLLEDRVSDHHERVILPGTVRLLAPSPRGEGDRILDVACGQGILCRRLADLGARVVGVDASPSLIERAKKIGGGERCEYAVADARRLGERDLGTFDAAACVMAIMNIEPTGPVFAGVAKVLKPGGRFVMVMLHPAFRSPGQTAWEWATAQPHPFAKRDPANRPQPQPKQFRRVDGYLSPRQREIVMNPGAVAAGKPPVVTLTFHRPIQTYVAALAEAGLRVDALEEWASVRTSQPGPRAAEENRARREIPMFLAIRAIKS